jgi:hypothetical protein
MSLRVEGLRTEHVRRKGPAPPTIRRSRWFSNFRPGLYSAHVEEFWVRCHSESSTIPKSAIVSPEVSSRQRHFCPAGGTFAGIYTRSMRGGIRALGVVYEIDESEKAGKSSEQSV